MTALSPHHRGPSVARWARSWSRKADALTLSSSPRESAVVAVAPDHLVLPRHQARGGRRDGHPARVAVELMTDECHHLWLADVAEELLEKSPRALGAAD